jgi:hypothetical protein
MEKIKDRLGGNGELGLIGFFFASGHGASWIVEMMA